MFPFFRRSSSSSKPSKEQSSQSAEKKPAVSTTEQSSSGTLQASSQPSVLPVLNVRDASTGVNSESLHTSEPVVKVKTEVDIITLEAVATAALATSTAQTPTDLPARPPPPSAQPTFIAPPSRKRKRSNSMATNATAIPPLPATLYQAFPPLFEIEDPELAKQVVTHSSFHQKPKNSAMMEAPCVDYEKLEHVGDAIIGSIVTTLLHEMYPNLKVGPSTELKSICVRDTTFAVLAEFYQLPERLIAAPAARLTARNQIKVKGSIFESYCAGLFYSHLKTNPSSTRGEAYLAVDEWLRKIYTPFAVWAYQWMKDEAERRTDVARASIPAAGSDAGPGGPALDIGQIDQLAQGSSAGLNQYCLTKFGKMPTYEYQQLGLANWQATAKLVLPLPKGTELVAVAARTNKKAAMNVAAYGLVQQLGL